MSLVSFKLSRKISAAASACCTVTPGFSRAMTGTSSIRISPGREGSRSSMAMGTQNSVSG